MFKLLEIGIYILFIFFVDVSAKLRKNDEEEERKPGERERTTEREKKANSMKAFFFFIIDFIDLMRNTLHCF